MLPKGITVFQRGWLSSNNILIVGKDSTALIDSGYVTHAPQTLALVESALGGRALDLLVNTHLHSDHCGGNAVLQAHYPDLKTLIPPGLAEHVRAWDPHALTYAPTGQNCPQFDFNEVLLPGSEADMSAHQRRGLLTTTILMTFLQTLTIHCWQKIGIASQISQKLHKSVFLRWQKLESKALSMAQRASHQIMSSV